VERPIKFNKHSEFLVNSFDEYPTIAKKWEAQKNSKAQLVVQVYQSAKFFTRKFSSKLCISTAKY
jgi:uncharacterized protein (DUF1697 family)